MIGVKGLLEEFGLVADILSTKMVELVGCEVSIFRVHAKRESPCSMVHFLIDFKTHILRIIVPLGQVQRILSHFRMNTSMSLSSTAPFHWQKPTNTLQDFDDGDYLSVIIILEYTIYLD